LIQPGPISDDNPRGDLADDGGQLEALRDLGAHLGEEEDNEDAEEDLRDVAHEYGPPPILVEDPGSAGERLDQSSIYHERIAAAEESTERQPRRDEQPPDSAPAIGLQLKPTRSQCRVRDQ
jgi:hypothetical protein